ncbi:MAG TPA: molecular chaperone HtpG [Gammaproteobacteria bacterium]|nr:molecular chaperone HtpG [Gammaproteobacteria bacterium]
MTVDAHQETQQFQTEVSQILNLVIRSLYSNKEIFLRELISNASDAAEKLRFEALSNDALYEGDADLSIRLSVDKENRTLTISDNGIGMNRDEVAENIGTIARSGTRAFFESMSGDDVKDSRLIGQFGVGFYSAYIVADRVTLISRRAGDDAENGVKWESDGKGSFTIETVEKRGRGTDIILHLNEDENEFLEGYRLRSVISKFSDHISMPVMMLKEDFAAQDEGEDDEKKEAEPEWEQVNTGTALWMRSKSEVTEEEYSEFYKHIAHDFEDPLAKIHNRVEGTNEYTSLLFVPKRAPFDLFTPEQKHGVKLYVRRVFIMDEADQLMPRYLRFIKGVVDADDLPLNVSREILQHSKKIDSIRNANVKRVLTLLEKMAKSDAEDYQTFWETFGKVLKEGPAEDAANAERIAGLLRFVSTTSEDDVENVSLESYIERMQDEQQKIYYMTADSIAAAKYSPHLEVFKKNDIEVLLLTDHVDEWLVSHLHEYKGKQLQSVAKGEIDLENLKSDEQKESHKKSSEEQSEFLERIKKALGGKAKEVRLSQRLTESPACLVVEDHDMSQNLARVLQQMGQDAPASIPTLEINLDHPVVSKLQSIEDQQQFEDLGSVIFDQAMLAEGGKLEDPAGFVRRLNGLLAEVK